MNTQSYSSISKLMPLHKLEDNLDGKTCLNHDKLFDRYITIRQRKQPMGITVGSDTRLTLKCFNIWWRNPTKGWHRSAGGSGWHLSTATGGPDVPLWWKRDVSAQNTSVTETAHPREDQHQRWDAAVLFGSLEGSSNTSTRWKLSIQFQEGLKDASLIHRSICGGESSTVRDKIKGGNK